MFTAVVLKKRNIFILLLTVLGAFLHFYNLTWGAPWYFHPDERNIASAVSQLSFPENMSPHFFAYGSLPIYAIYFTGILIQNLQHFQFSHPTMQLSFPMAILIGRIYSALFATLLIPLLYSLGKQLSRKHTTKQQETAGLLAATLATFSTGIIQFAHFGTFEMWLTFFGVLLFWTILQYLHTQKHELRYLLGMAVVSSILCAIKISSLVLVLIPVVALFVRYKPFLKHHAKKAVALSHLVLMLLTSLCFFATVAAFIYIITNPFVFLETQDFLSSMRYESAVAMGTEHVFYTGGFFDTTVVLYQLLHVYPFLLNPLVTFFFVPLFAYFLYQSIRTKNQSYLLLITFYVILFLSQAVLFVKWTRYMMPTVPFIYLIISLTFINNRTMKQLSNSSSSPKHFIKPILIILVGASMIFSLAYFKTAFLSPDTRIEALSYAKLRIPETAHILSEPYDLGITPFQATFSHIQWFNFYELDNKSPDATKAALQQQLADASYIILPSQRLLQTRTLNKKQFPKGYTFYQQLLHGQFGYQKIYETPCDIFCQIIYLGDPVYWWEQTASVFDRPTVFIFQKKSNSSLEKNEQSILQ